MDEQKWWTLTQSIIFRHTHIIWNKIKGYRNRHTKVVWSEVQFSRKIRFLKNQWNMDLSLGARFGVNPIFDPQEMSFEMKFATVKVQTKFFSCCTSKCSHFYWSVLKMKLSIAATFSKRHTFLCIHMDRFKDRFHILSTITPKLLTKCSWALFRYDSLENVRP